MPITLTCPKCDLTMQAPDSAAGKRVKCPECDKVLAVPAAEDDFEVVDDDAPPKRKPRPRDDDDEPVRPRARKRPRRDDDDEEDYDDEDDRPRRRKKGRKAPPKNNLPLIIGGSVAAVVILGLAGFLLFGGKGADKIAGVAGATGTKDSSGWVAFQVASLRGNCPGGVPTPDAEYRRKMLTDGTTGDVVSRSNGSYKFFAAHLIPAGGLTDDKNLQMQVLDLMANMMKQNYPGAALSVSQTSVSGFPARTVSGTVRGTGIVIRIVLASDRFYIYGAEGRGKNDSDSDIQRFINDITFG